MAGSGMTTRNTPQAEKKSYHALRSHNPGLTTHQWGCSAIAFTPRSTSRYRNSFSLSNAFLPLVAFTPAHCHQLIARRQRATIGVELTQSRCTVRECRARPEDLRSTCKSRPDDRIQVLGRSLFTPDWHLTWTDRKSTRLNSSHSGESRMPSSA